MKYMHFKYKVDIVMVAIVAAFVVKLPTLIFEKSIYDSSRTAMQ